MESDSEDEQTYQQSLERMELERMEWSGRNSDSGRRGSSLLFPNAQPRTSLTTGINPMSADEQNNRRRPSASSSSSSTTIRRPNLSPPSLFEQSEPLLYQEYEEYRTPRNNTRDDRGRAEEQRAEMMQWFQEFMLRLRDDMPPQPRVRNDELVSDAMRQAMVAIQNLSAVTSTMCTRNQRRVDSVLDHIDQFVYRQNMKVSPDATRAVIRHSLSKAMEAAGDLSKGQDVSKRLLQELLDEMTSRVPGFGESDRTKVRKRFEHFQKTYIKQFGEMAKIMTYIRANDSGDEFQRYCSKLETQCKLMYGEGLTYWVEAVLKDV